MNSSRLAQAAGALAVLLGAAVLAGWALDVHVLKALVPGLATMKANTALGFLFAGAALAWCGADSTRPGRWARASVALVFALGALTVVEHVARVDLRIDELLFDDPATPPEYFPGRMSLATSLGFVFGAAALLLLPGAGGSAARAAAASGLGLGVALLGAIGLAGYAIQLDVLYAWPAFGTVAAHTAAGFAVLGTGILLAGRARLPALTEDLRITGLAASLLALAATATGLAAYVTLESGVERSLAEGVSLALQARVSEMRSTIELRTARAEIITTRPNMLRYARLHAEDPSNAQYRAVVRGVLESFISHGFSGVAVLDRRGERYAWSGAFVESADMDSPVAAGTGTSILWRKGFYLRNRLPLRDAAGPLGEVLAEQPLPNLDEALSAPQPLGASAELLLCTPGADAFRCFPSRFSPAAPFSIPVDDSVGRTRLVRRATESGAGFGTALDYRGQRVLGAFAPVGATGLVAVLKVDAAEVYAPLASRFQLTLVLVAAFAIGGALLVHARVRPLAGALEHKVRERTAQLETHAERLRIVHEIDKAIISAVTPEAIAAAVLQPMRELLGVPRAVVNLFDHAAGQVEWLAAAGRHRTHVGPGVRYPLHFMGDLDALRRGEPQVIETSKLPVGPEREALLKSGVRRYLAVPMIVRGELIGAVSFGGEQLAFPAEQISIAQECATQLAIAISQARLFERVQRNSEELESRVLERTAELEAVNKELSGFSYSVSHDLRAPLRAVDGYARMLEEDYAARLDEEGRRLLTVIRDSAGRMGQLIDDLLNFSRLGRQPMVRHQVDTSALVNEVIQEVRGQSAASIEVRDLARAHGDRALLKQVWINLIGNALKYSAKRDAPRIEIGGQVDGEENIYWVRDNGAGFDMRYATKLFGVFQRLHSQDDFSGTGVGLAIVQRVVTRHGGRVWAEGKPDAGASFFFSLPRGA